MLDVERGTRDAVEQLRIQKRCHWLWPILAARNAARPGKVGTIFCRRVEIARLQKVVRLVLAFAMRVELYRLLICIGEGDGADRRGDRAGGGARHDLDAHPVIRDLAGIEIVAGLLPFIERLDQEIETTGSIGTSRGCPRLRETDLKFVTPFSAIFGLLHE
jgi:hypothetical protein